MNLSRIIERHAQFAPAKTAIHFQERDIAYAELWHRIDAATHGLAARLGVRKGDRIAFLGYNHPEMVVMLFALARLGAMLVPLNFRLAPPEHRVILDHADVTAVMVEPDFFAHCAAIRSARPELRRVALSDAPQGWLDWRAIAAPGARPAEIAGEDADPVLIVYTSGTTGAPKGAVHTQAALLWNMICSTHYHDLTAADHVLTVLPMFHVGGLCIQTLPALHAGATVTVEPRFDPGRWIDAVAQRRPTLSLLVPATMKALLAHPQWPKADLSPLRMLCTGSSIIPESMIQAFFERGVTMTQVYGSTETGPVSIYLRAEDARRKAGFAGKAGLHVEIRLVDGEGRDVPPGRVGEIWVRALNLMQGYWRDPDNPSFRDGWFRSGDLAYQDEEGFYKVVGRSKDMIISGGENIYPAEIENILAECDDILEAAVVGVEDAKWGEAVVAAIVRRAGSALDEAAVMKLLEGRIARYKQPRRVAFLEALPKTALGKVQKPEVRKMLK